MRIRLKPFYATDDAGGGGDEPTKERGSDVLARYNGDTLKMAEKLAEVLNDNHGLREKNRALKQQAAEVQAKLPGEGSIILTAEQAKELETYRALGEPKALKAALEGHAPIQQELATLKREKALSKAAEATGFKPSVLATLAGDLDIQTKSAKDGKPVAVVVKDGAEIALSDFAEKEWKDFLPSLKATGQAPDINAGARGNGNGPTVTDEQRKQISERYRHTF